VSHETNSCHSRPDVLKWKRGKNNKLSKTDTDSAESDGNEWIKKDNIWTCTERILMLTYTIMNIGQDEMIIEHLTDTDAHGVDVRLMFNDGLVGIEASGRFRLYL
jgi:hypothetical protein